MKSAPIEVFCPDSLDALIDLLDRYQDDARILAGGQTLIPMLAMRVASPSILIDINQVINFPKISAVNQRLEVGALIRHAELEEFLKSYPDHLLSKMVPWVAHAAIRNRGTVCGSICHADPSSEWVLALLVLDGYINLMSKKKKRRVKAKDFFLGPLQTCKLTEEVVVSVDFHMVMDGVRYGFSEYGYRHGDFAIVSAAVVKAGNTWTIGFGGVSDIPLVYELGDVDEMECKEFIEKLSHEVDVREDPSATAAYRRFLMRSQALQALSQII